MKKKWITLAIVLAIIVAIFTYLNYDKIEEYMESKSWQLADSIATIQTDDITQIATGKSLIALTKNSIDLYKDTEKVENSIALVTSEIITSTANNYTVIGDKISGNIYMMKDNEKVWETKVSGTIFDIVVNKNGYVAVTYYQSGYKSTIKVLKTNGEELFTTFLASTYAADVVIADNNKILAVAEIDTEGIKLISKIKIIEIDSSNETKVNTIYEDSDNLILDIEYTGKNELLILKDNGVIMIDNKNVASTILEYDYSNVAYSTIENGENAVIVRKISAGIFGSESVLEIYDNNNKKEYELESTPQSICVQNKTIALNLGNEVVFVGTNGNLIKRYKLGGQLKDIKLYDNGNMVALVFKNKIELIKI
ncbi:MAG: hypothetical protein J6B87_02680 [Clostridia bacterium]|nr:hypothetical protein [Clostridia bacterium]